MMPLTNRRFGSSFAPGLLLVWLLPEVGRADEPRWLELVASPAECPAGAEIERDIGRLVGTGPRERGTLRAVVDVAGSDEQGWRARVQSEYGGEIGERTLEGATCRAVARAAALVISLTIDSNVGRLESREASAPRELPTPRVSAPRELEAVARVTGVPEIAPRAPLRPWVGLGPRSEVGLWVIRVSGSRSLSGARLPARFARNRRCRVPPRGHDRPGTAAGGGSDF
jgi:hypothetical protein